MPASSSTWAAALGVIDSDLDETTPDNAGEGTGTLSRTADFGGDMQEEYHG